MRIATGAPLCRPMPLHSTAERIVCSGVKKEITLANGVDYARVQKVVCGKKATVNNECALPGRLDALARENPSVLKKNNLLHFEDLKQAPMAGAWKANCRYFRLFRARSGLDVYRFAPETLLGL
jgi:hypothetical protein